MSIVITFIIAIIFWVLAEIIREHVLGWRCNGLKEHMLHLLICILVVISAAFSSAGYDEISSIVESQPTGHSK